MQYALMLPLYTRFLPLCREQKKLVFQEKTESMQCVCSAGDVVDMTHGWWARTLRYMLAHRVLYSQLLFGESQTLSSPHEVCKINTRAAAAFLHREVHIAQSRLC